MLLFVGDRNQAILGFTGADNDAMDLISRDFNCASLPLTVTRRCSKAVVRRAQTLVPSYRAHSSNPEGSDTTITEDEFFDATLLIPGEDAVICRNTAPLVRAAYKLIARGVPAHVEGRDIGIDLVQFVKRFRKAKTVLQLRDALKANLDKQVENLTKEKKDHAIEALVEQTDTIYAIMETLPEHASIEVLIQDIENLFADTPSGQKANKVVLMTAHRSKGLEFRRVFGWGRDHYFPSPFAKLDWQLEQENHLMYVLYTRAIMDYVDVKVEA